MQRITPSGMILGILLFCCAGVLPASETEELRERANAMRKEASVLAKRGHREEAQRLEKESVELLEAAERMERESKRHGAKGDHPGVDEEVHHLKERLQDLLAQERKMKEAKAPQQELAEVREQISARERELHAIHAHHAEQAEHHPEFSAHVKKLEVASRRIHHIRVAAENLKLAEFHDIAQQLMEKAAAMEREVREAKERLDAEMRDAHGHPGEPMPEVVRDLRAEIQRLRAEVKELRQQAESRK